MNNNLRQAELLKDIGLVDTWIGVDSMHPMASKVIGKGMKAEKKKELIYKVGEIWQGIVNIKVGYILGLPGEDSQYVRDTVDWFLDEKNPVNQLNLNPLRILPPLDPLKHTSRSDIDLNYKKYGYDIPDLNQFWEWTKDDGTDITSFTKTSELCFELTEKIKKRKSLIPEYFTGTGITDPVTQYFDPLIKSLQK
jgi:hypothetical protein